MRHQRGHRLAVVDAGLEPQPHAVRQRIELRHHVEARVLAQPQHVDRGQVGQEVEPHSWLVLQEERRSSRNCSRVTWIVVSSRKRTDIDDRSGNAARSTMSAGCASMSSWNQRSRDQASSSSRASFSPSTSLTGAEAPPRREIPWRWRQPRPSPALALNEPLIRLEVRLSRVVASFGPSRRRVGRERRRAPPWPPAVRRGDFPRRRRSPASGPSSRT